MSQYSKIYQVTFNGNKYQIHKEVLEQFDYFEPLMNNKFGDKEINLDFDADVNFDEFVDMMYKAYAMRDYLSKKFTRESFRFYGPRNAKELISVLNIIEYLKPKNCMEIISNSLNDYMRRNINREFIGTLTIDDIAESNFSLPLKKVLIREYIILDNPYNFNIDGNNKVYDIIYENENKGKIILHNLDKFVIKYNKNIKATDLKILLSEHNHFVGLIVEIGKNYYKRQFYTRKHLELCSDILAEVITDSILGINVNETEKNKSW